MVDTQRRLASVRGTWWVAGHEDVRVPGTLSRVGDTWQLDIHGILPDGVMWTRGLSLTAPVRIHGHSDSELLTLAEAYLDAGNPSEQLRSVSDGSGGINQTWQRWRAYQLVRGVHLLPDTKLHSASFRLTRLESWWRASGIKRATTDFGSYQSPPSLTARWAGAEITLWNRLVTGMGVRSHSITEQPMVMVRSDEGFTLTWLQESIVQPLEALLAACLHQTVEAYEFHLELGAIRDGMPESAEVDPGVTPELQDSWAYETPVLSADQIDFAAFLPRWLDMAEAIPLVVASCSRDERKDPLQLAVVSALHTAETLQRWLHPSSHDTELAAQVAALLKSSDLNRRQRKKVLGAVQLSTQPSLEERLVQLGLDMGEEFHLWFLNRSLREWALVAATVRNALSHGYPTKHRVERDIGAPFGILYTLTAITRLRMLVHAGLPNDFELVKLLIQDQRYLGLLHQNVADWKGLAAKIRETSQP